MKRHFSAHGEEHGCFYTEECHRQMNNANGRLRQNLNEGDFKEESRQKKTRHVLHFYLKKERKERKKAKKNEK